MTDSKKIRNLFTDLLKAVTIPFPAKGLLDITCEHGVYIIYNPDKHVWHVGTTTRGANGLC